VLWFPNTFRWFVYKVSLDLPFVFIPSPEHFYWRETLPMGRGRKRAICRYFYVCYLGDSFRRISYLPSYLASKRSLVVFAKVASRLNLDLFKGNLSWVLDGVAYHNGYEVVGFVL
jgi:hypothetical protein